MIPPRSLSQRFYRRRVCTASSHDIFDRLRSHLRRSTLLDQDRWLAKAPGRERDPQVRERDEWNQRKKSLAGPPMPSSRRVSSNRRAPTASLPREERLRPSLLERASAQRESPAQTGKPRSLVWRGGNSSEPR